MRSVKSKLFAGAAAAALSSVTAPAADMPQPVMYQQPMVMPLPPQPSFDTWYLRGDVGVAMLKQTDLEYIRNPATPPNDFEIISTKIGDSTFVGGGVGYQFNEWLRFDVTGEYRTRASLFAFGAGTFGAASFLDIYNAHIKTWAVMGNVYADLGTWWCLTPFVGLGVGGAYNTFEKLTDFGTPFPGYGEAKDNSAFSLAWAIHAGVAYEVNKSFKVELAYRYFNFGDVESPIQCAGVCAPDSYRLKELASHDFKLGFRWLLGDITPPKRVPYGYAPPPPPAPVYVQPQIVQAPPQPVYQQPQYAPPPPPQPVYQQPQYAPPPPVYQQPPLMRKG